MRGPEHYSTLFVLEPEARPREVCTSDSSINRAKDELLAPFNPILFVAILFRGVLTSGNLVSGSDVEPGGELAVQHDFKRRLRAHNTLRIHFGDPANGSTMRLVQSA